MTSAMRMEGMATAVGAADHAGSDPDLYQLLGVPPEAPRAEITRAWRRRARAEHPDSRPGDADAPGRFRAVAEAYQVLGDPASRAAYDRALGRGQQPAVRIRVRRPPGRGGTGGMTPPVRPADPPVRPADPPVRAGPVRIEGVRPPSRAGGGQDEEYTLAVLAELAVRYLARDRGRPW